MKIVKAYGLVKSYPNFLLHIDELEIEKGELVVLLGPNGSGKSTLMRILSGVLRPDGGEVYVFGGIPAENPNVRRDIAFIPGEPSLYDHLTAQEHIRLAEDLWGDERDAYEIAKLLGFGNENRNKLVQELSSGLRRILSISIALGHPFEFAIIDEVTAFLDPPAIATFIELIKGYKRKGKTVLASTHILPIVELMEPDRVILMSRGKIVASDTLENLKGSEDLLDVFSSLTGEEVPIDEIRKFLGE